MRIFGITTRRRFAAAAALCRRLVTARRASVAIITALAFPLMLGFVGLTAEVGTWLVVKRAMQGAADAAAFSAAVTLQSNQALPTSQSYPMACTTAMGVAAQNGYGNAVSGFTCGANGYDCPAGTTQTCVNVNIPPTSGNCISGCKYAAEVIIQAKQGALIAGFFGAVGATIEARAVSGVAAAATAPACILALGNNNQSITNGVPSNTQTNPGPADAFQDTAGGNITLTNCTVCDDSTNVAAAGHDTAGGTLTATAIDVVGGWSGGGATSPAPTTGAQPCTDPYQAKYPESTYSRTCGLDLPVNAGTATGGATLNFASTTIPNGSAVQVGMQAYDWTSASSTDPITAGTYVSAVSGTTVTLSANAAKPVQSFTMTATGSGGVGSKTLKFSSSDPNIANVGVGMIVSGTGVPAGTTVTTAPSSGQIGISNALTANPATATISFDDVITFGWYLNGQSSYKAGVAGQTNFVYCANGFSLDNSPGATTTIGGSSYNQFPSGTYYVLGGKFSWTGGENVTNASGGITFILGGESYQFTTNAATASGSTTLTFPALELVKAGVGTTLDKVSLSTAGDMTVSDLTNTSAIPSGTTISAISTGSGLTTMTMSAAATGTGVFSGDTIQISISCGSGVASSRPNANGYAWLDWTGGGSLNFSGPTTGTFAGMLAMVDPCSPFETTTSVQSWVDITAGNSTIFNGAIYAPSSLITTTEGATATASCLQIIGNIVQTTAGGSLTGSGCNNGTTAITSQVPGAPGIILSE